MKLLLYVLVAVIAALAAGGARPAFAQESAGGYTTRVGGQTFGTETYKITGNADGSRREFRRRAHNVDHLANVVERELIPHLRRIGFEV